MVFEGQAAMDLEFLASLKPTEEFFPVILRQDFSPWILDWQPMIAMLLEEKRQGGDPGMLAAKFHNALVQGVIQVAKAAGIERVALSGGCFLNRILTEKTVEGLQKEGFKVYWHQRVPPGDGGIALGQVMCALDKG
jgi:hydrogenase maturation protein HypF